MVKVINFYLDESGSKCPDRNPKDQLPGHEHDFFAFGGVILKDEDENQARQLHKNFCDDWNINYPPKKIHIIIGNPLYNSKLAIAFLEAAGVD